MFNRYVDGLGTTLRADPAGYAAASQALVRDGYLGILAQPAGR